jgi:hypothetical protein
MRHQRYSTVVFRFGGEKGDEAARALRAEVARELRQLPVCSGPFASAEDICIMRGSRESSLLTLVLTHVGRYFARTAHSLC